VVFVVAAVLLLAAVLAVVAVVSRATRHNPPATQTVKAPHVVSAPRDDRTAANLDVVSGASSVTVRGTDLGDRLYRVETPDDGALVPSVADEGGRLQVHLADSGQKGPSSVTILLSTAVTWGLRLGGGASEEHADLSVLQLSGVELAAGAGTIELSVPRPAGTLTVHITGGTGSFTMHAAGGVPVRAKIDHGAASVTIDGDKRSGLGPNTVIEPAGWNSATDRYDIDAPGGVSNLTVDRR
jgi:hypothetical protein